MYWSKIATTEKEFDAIAALNYETFVEEIPQHTSNNQKRLVDKFHTENTYIVVYKGIEIVGMAAFRDKRPFSIDQKIGIVEKHLAPEDCAYLCEIRLLAVKKAHRNGRVFSKLATAIYRYYYDKGYTACVISGTVREEKLYSEMGFKQFAPAVGTEEARFLPMVLTRKDSAVFRERLRENNAVFYPGPVALEFSIEQSVLSHRSFQFEQELAQMKETLCQLTSAKFVIPMVGSGTLANDAMLGQLKSDFNDGRGLFLTNGEFGNRLIHQAQQWDLSFDWLDFGWGQPFSIERIEQQLQTDTYRYIVFVHSETSNSTMNPLEDLKHLAARYDIALCADCVSSFGATPFSMAHVHYATASSGKALGTIAGVAFVFCKEAPQVSVAPLYMNLPYYMEKTIPFTLPHFLVQSVNTALKAYPVRFEILQNRLELVRKAALPIQAVNPIIATLQHDEMPKIMETCALNGFLLHGDSGYLKERHSAQISMIQPKFERDFKKVAELIENIMKTL
ncbi:aminotransferase class V-fold PLP-dependent enzyme [Solibacillus daqui]|uniref:aminotransferase class V-fold PLP-dependent enzyme n=1 Tax=Solibacillus daqui TaxID=2912187 RepID=UPI0023670AC0|nr:aminotransferase class V-fold PLP-dependent enzyme [Solibacillus daqui]